MSYNEILADTNTTITINTNDSFWVVNEGVTIDTVDFGVQFGALTYGNHLLVNGTVNAAQIAVKIAAKEHTIIISETGILSAKTGLSLANHQNIAINHGLIASDVDSAVGISILGTNQSAFNYGVIALTGQATTAGIRVIGADAVLENHGSISAAVGVQLQNSFVNLLNGKNGVISGNETGISIKSDYNEANEINNFGKISGTQFAIFGELGDEKIVNAGLIEGSVQLGEGNDIYIGAGGTFTGAVFDMGLGNDTIDIRDAILKSTTSNFAIKGGIGNDTYLINSKDMPIYETADGGNDTVKSEVSHELSANFENLTLLGKANINATGNAADNLIIGNDGKNILAGGGGYDVFFGGGGSDTVSFAGFTTGGALASLLTGKITGEGGKTSTMQGIENLRGSKFIDLLNGDDGKNILEGGGGGDLINGNGGMDLVSYLHSAAGVKINLATHVYRGGDAAGDILGSIEGVIGSAFRDRLTGDSHDNWLKAGGGNDILTGGGGEDHFFFSRHFGSDKIRDFDAGIDLIDFSEGPRLFKNFNKMMQHSEQHNNDVIIHHGDDQLVLRRVDLADLHASDFIF